MQTIEQLVAALEAANLGMLRSLGVLEAVAQINEQAGLVALIDAGKHVLGSALEDSDDAIAAIKRGGTND